jgi:hypothetical protein
VSRIEEEPENVQVARALKITDIEWDTLRQAWIGLAPGYHCPDRLPDFANDPAFVVRMFNSNRLCADLWQAGIVVYRESMLSRSKGWGRDLGHAVAQWIVAAAAAGVEIKR